MSIIDASEVKLPGEANQNNLPPKCGQRIDGGINAMMTTPPKSTVEVFRLWDSMSTTSLKDLNMTQ
jgi:hypothetical protein